MGDSDTIDPKRIDSIRRELISQKENRSMKNVHFWRLSSTVVCSRSLPKLKTYSLFNTFIRFMKMKVTDRISVVVYQVKNIAAVHCYHFVLGPAIR